MRLFHDLDYGFFTSVRGGPSPLRRIDLKVGDQVTIELEFFRSGIPYVPASLDELIFVIKSGYGEADPALALILTDAWETESDSDLTVQVFRASLGTNTELLRTAVGTSEVITLKGELTATLDGLGPDSTATIPVRIFNDLWKGDESSPDLLPTPDDEWLAHGHPQTLTGEQKAQALANLGLPAINNYTATSAPTLNDDETLGYSVGSKWYDTANSEAYICFDATEGGAIWQLATLTVEDLGGAAFLEVGDTEGTVAAGNDRRIGSRVVTGNTTAINDETLTVVATATITDPPVPVEGKGFKVFVANGTATVGPTAYSTAGTIIERKYHSGSWQTNRVYLDKAQTDALYAALSHVHTAEGLDYANSTDIGAALTDADEVMLSDGGGNTTRRKSALSRFWTYIQGKFDGVLTIAGAKTWSGLQRATGQNAIPATSDELMTRAQVDQRLLANIWSGRLTRFTLTGWRTVVTGAGAVRTWPDGHGSLILRAGSATGSALATASGTTTGASFLARAGGDTRYINYSERVRVIVRFAEVSGLSTNCFYYLRFDQAGGGSPAIGDPSARSIGFKVTNLSGGSGQLLGVVHDGTAPTISGSSLATITNRTAYVLVIDSLGNGTVDYYLNGSLVGSLTGGPTGNTASGVFAPHFGVSNGGDSTDTTLQVADLQVLVGEF